MKIHDITAPLSGATPAYPGDPHVEIVPHTGMAGGDSCSVHRITLSSHSGTHLDAPSHYIPGATTIDRIPPERLIGEALVTDLSGIGRIGPQDLEEILRDNRMVLLKTRKNPPPAVFDPRHSFITEPAAHLLVRRGTLLVGIDTPSIEEHDGDGTVHRLLLENGVLILEGIDLSRVSPGKYDLVCLPLPLAGCDGSPVRALLIEQGNHPSFDPHTTRWPLS